MFIVLLLAIVLFLNEIIFSQNRPDCICGTEGTGYQDPDSIIGGRFKPVRTDIGGATQDEDFFPVLIVFVQFSDEPYSYSTNPDAWNSGQPPNYIDSLVRPNRASTSSSWWNSYNGYAISDYWQEFSRGKLHITGRTESIILPNATTWYENNGGITKVNKDIYDTLKQRLQAYWLDFDKWSLTKTGVFLWSKDKLVDMMYVVFRQWKSFLLGGDFLGLATLGDCLGSSNYAYTVYTSSQDTVKIYSLTAADTLGSGFRIHADYGNFSKQRFLDLATHEHGHYFLGWSHNNYSKMSFGVGYSNGWEFSLSPWEVVKLGYIKPEFPNYSTPVNYLYDYSSHGQNGADTNEVIQIPISSDGGEFFLLANRRKESQWDRRMGGDTLADDRWQYLKNINQEYGKGLYVYHVKDAYESNHPNLYGVNEDPDLDLECADGLWNWIPAGVVRKRINNLEFETVYKKQYVSYNNDYSDDEISGYTSGKDEMSRAIIFTPGSADNFSSNPIGRGTHSIYTNENDYWYSLASIGDSWDGWNVGYNEVFSPYSSPNTKTINNNSTGIFIWYRHLDNSNNKATIEIYRTGYGGKTETDILRISPPTRPMGLRVLTCDSLLTMSGCKRTKLRWNHNMEPDMANLVQGYQSYTKEYKIYRSTEDDMNSIPNDAMYFPELVYDYIATVYIDETGIAEYTDTELISVCNSELCAPPNYCVKYPVRYRVQAVDKYNSLSVLSDFAKTEAWSLNAGEGGDNFKINNSSENNSIPKEYSLKQNYPNPFNPITNIQYDLPFDNFVTIKIFDILGKGIMTIVNEFKNAGSYIVSLNGSDLPSGIYYYKIEAGNFKQVRKNVLIK